MKDEYDLIQKSGLFDESFYIETYHTHYYTSDLIWHFLVYGCHNDYQPNQWFDPKLFYAQNPNVSREFNPFAWYLENRSQQLIFISKQQENEYNLVKRSNLFNEKFYTTKYAVKYIDVAYHYITLGYQQDFDPSPEFSNKNYAELNPDLTFTDYSHLGHYLLFGIKEKRYKDQQHKIYETIKNSEFFDATYYAKQLPANVDLVKHYIQYGNNEGRNPSTKFNTRQYQLLNPDVFLANVNALYHYESTGREEHRAISLANCETVTFPQDAVEEQGAGEFGQNTTGRVAVFASYNKDCLLSASAKYYLQALQTVCDQIVFVTDNPVLPEVLPEIKKLVTYYVCKRHCMYDFGSYKIGIEIFRSKIGLDSIKELLLCNDSMYGPLDGFENIFAKMSKKNCDFWGLSIAQHNIARSHILEYLQAFFIVFKRNIFMSKKFYNFFDRVQQETNRSFVVIKYEFQLTNYFRQDGYIYDAFLDTTYCEQCAIPTKHTYDLISNYNYPLIKKKVIFGTSLDKKEDILEYVKIHNQVLYKIMFDDGCMEQIYTEYQQKIQSMDDYNVIRNSNFFDRDFYLKEYFNVYLNCLDPVTHYLQQGFKEGNNPSSKFSSLEYNFVNLDVQKANMNPLLHYERYGRIQKRACSIKGDNIKEPVFPKQAKKINKQCKNFQTPCKRVAIFASFQSACKVPAYVVYYLQALLDVTDYIIFVTDNPLLPDEIQKIENTVGYILCQRHGEYDFGSYKRGFEWLAQNTDITNIDEIIFCNDSCVGPVAGFETLFSKMESIDCDAWGVAKSMLYAAHLQSYFIVLKRKVFSSDVFIEFINSVQHEISSYNVIFKYEVGLGRLMRDNGWLFEGFICSKDLKYQPHSHPQIFLHENFPLIKVKALNGTYTVADSDAVLAYLKKENHDLYRIIKEDRLDIHKKHFFIENNKNTITTNTVFGKIKHKKIIVHFYVDRLSMFSARPLFEKMLKDNFFDPYIVVVPDLRFGEEYEITQREKTLTDLENLYDNKKILRSWTKDASWAQEDCVYRDYSYEADLVCYSTCYSSSYIFYRVEYVSRTCRTILINYGYFRSKYDRHILSSESFSLFWKVFLESTYNLQEAQKYSKNQAQNCVLMGYSKMDLLASVPLSDSEKQQKRKTILLAPHHSIPSGHNHVMHLSNFLQYADFFLQLPLRYPSLEFLFRPHPMLFEVLAKPTFWGKNKTDAYLTKMDSFSNASVHQEGDYFTLFAQSDAMIHDCGSFLVEYFYTLKPQCYLLKDEYEINDLFVDLGKECLRRVYKAFNVQHIYQFLNNVVLEEKDPLKNERTTFAQNKIMLNYPNVSNKIIDYLKSELFQ